MYKIGFIYPPGGGGGGGTVPLPTPNWPDNISLLANATSGPGTAGIQVTWPTSQPNITLRIVSSNVIASPALTGNTNNFRVGISNSSNVMTPPAAVFNAYTSNDFTIVVNKNQYVWFRLGPSGTSRTVTVLNASNNDTLLDTFVLTAGPLITPASNFVERISVVNRSTTYNYLYLQTVQVSGLPSGTPTTPITITWSLTFGPDLPKLYYYLNHPEVTTTGNTLISNLNTPYNTASTRTPTSAGFTEYIQGTSSITVSSGTFITFAAFYPGFPLPNTLNQSIYTITSAAGGTIATGFIDTSVF
jgi:hypothetical protein